MAQIGFPNLAKSIKLPNGTTYAYVHVPPKDDKPYLLLLHGFPSSSYDWRHQILYFEERGYGLIVPDLLGYGGTDKPKEKEAYKLKKMSDEVVGILDAEAVKVCVGVGHDWGSTFLSRLANYYPDRFTKFCWMGVGYTAPTDEDFSVGAINEMTKKTIGWPVFGYWHFFNDEDAGALMDRNHDSVDSLCYPHDPLWMKDNMCYPGAARTYFLEQKVGPLAPWVSKEELATHDKIFAAEDGGYGPPLNWYRCQISNLNAGDDRGIPEEKRHINQPTLMIAAKLDYICVPAIQVGGMQPFVKDLKVVEVESAHWNQLERPLETNRALEEFVEGK
ncbi:MAG: hypothetical protein Q9217_003031 [Psora testacea]